MAKIEEAARIAHETHDLGAPEASSSKRTIDPEADPDGLDDAKKKTKTSKDTWKGADDVMNYSDARSLGLATELDEPTENDKEARMKEGFVGQWEAVVRLPKATVSTLPAEGTTGSGLRGTTNKISVQLSSHQDSDRAPPHKLFSERRPDLDSDPTEGIAIKVKVDRRAQARIKREQEAAEAGRFLPGSLQPIRLDGIKSEAGDDSIIKSESNFDRPDLSCDSVLTVDPDVKPDVTGLNQLPPATAPPPECAASTLFKKRKPTKAQPRQRT